MSPRAYSRQHVKERALNRYDTTLTNDDYNWLNEQISADTIAQFPKFKQINQEGTQVTLVVTFKDQKFIAVFDKATGLLKTLLPPEQFGGFFE
jgi:hypothetical protein